MLCGSLGLMKADSAGGAGDYITTPTATPAAFGDAFEGGFYTGMIWNEVVQTTTSTLIATGSKTFTVADMGTTPIVYAGQLLEVRSRANPFNQMVGTVTSAAGTDLTLNITGIGGSGTFTDWSVMSRYRVIVAPKATGERSSTKYKNANSSAPADCITLSEGYKATIAMVAADTATVYPAAHWCKNLSIAGKTDWYLPARDELELVWRNLKATTDDNTVGNRTATTLNYTTLGSYGGTTSPHGLDDNSSPAGAAHTTSDPTQVAAGKNFRTGEAEALSPAVFWSSSEFAAAQGWAQYRSGFPGGQYAVSKSSSYYVRAVRRSII